MIKLFNGRNGIATATKNVCRANTAKLRQTAEIKCMEIIKELKIFRDRAIKIVDLSTN